MGLLFEWIVAIHYNAYVTIWEFVKTQFWVSIALAGWLWQGVLIYQDKARFIRPRRRPI